MWFDVQDFACVYDAKIEFVKQFWGENQQAKFHEKLYLGKYKTNKGARMADYALDLARQAKLLDPPMGDAEIIRCVKRHFDKEIVREIKITTIKTVADLTGLLEEVQDEKELNIKNREEQKPSAKSFGSAKKSTSSGYRNNAYKWQSGKSNGKTGQATTGRGNANKNRDANRQKQPIVEFPTSESEQERKYSAKKTGSKFVKGKTDQKKNTNDRGKKGGKAINAIKKGSSTVEITKSKKRGDKYATSSEDDTKPNAGYRKSKAAKRRQRKRRRLNAIRRKIDSASETEEEDKSSETDENANESVEESETEESRPPSDNDETETSEESENESSNGDEDNREMRLETIKRNKQRYTRKPRSSSDEASSSEQASERSESETTDYEEEKPRSSSDEISSSEEASEKSESEATDYEKYREKRLDAIKRAKRRNKEKPRSSDDGISSSEASEESGSETTDYKEKYRERQLDAIKRDKRKNRKRPRSESDVTSSNEETSGESESEKSEYGRSYREKQPDTVKRERRNNRKKPPSSNDETSSNEESERKSEEETSGDDENSQKTQSVVIRCAKRGKESEQSSNDNESSLSDETNEEQSEYEEVHTNDDCARCDNNGQSSDEESKYESLEYNNDEESDITHLAIIRTRHLLQDIEENDDEIEEEDAEMEPIIPINVGNTVIETLIDTGSETSIMTRETANRLSKAKEDFDKIPVRKYRLVGAFGEKGQTAPYKIQIKMLISDSEMIHEFYVTDRLAHPMIIGNDAFVKHRAAILYTDEGFKFVFGKPNNRRRKPNEKNKPTKSITENRKNPRK